MKLLRGREYGKRGARELEIRFLAENNYERHMLERMHSHRAHMSSATYCAGEMTLNFWITNRDEEGPCAWCEKSHHSTDEEPCKTCSRNPDHWDCYHEHDNWCKIHKKYTGKFRPRVKCAKCEQIYKNRHGHG